jgi:hypothetical protein
MPTRTHNSRRALKGRQAGALTGFSWTLSARCHSSTAERPQIDPSLLHLWLGGNPHGRDRRARTHPPHHRKAQGSAGGHVHRTATHPHHGLTLHQKGDESYTAASRNTKPTNSTHLPRNAESSDKAGPCHDIASLLGPPTLLGPANGTRTKGPAPLGKGVNKGPLEALAAGGDSDNNPASPRNSPPAKEGHQSPHMHPTTKRQIQRRSPDNSSANSSTSGTS